MLVTTALPTAPYPFIGLLRDRVGRGESMAAIGRELGVSKQAVAQWISGKTTPSKTVLLLAEVLMRGPREMSDGLPGVSCLDRVAPKG